MTSRRIQKGSFVRERRRGAPLYGKVESEAGTKVWNVLFYNRDKTEERKSSQLTFVSSSELPPRVAPWFIEAERQASPILTPGTTSPFTPRSNAPSTPGSNNFPSTPGSDSSHDSRIVRRKSTVGKSVQRTTVRRRKNFQSSQQRRVLFAEDEDSDKDSWAEEEEVADEVEVADEDEQDDIVMTFDRLLQHDESLANEDLETQKHRTKLEQALNEKRNLIGQRVDVKNSNNPSTPWKVVNGFEDPSTITAKSRPEEETGVLGIDFNKLADADFPLVEVFLRFWPGDAIQQLSRLNVALKARYKKDKPVTMKEFFAFIACLFAAVPAGFGGGKLWNPTKAKSIFPQPDLASIMSWTRFSRIKTVFAAAFHVGHIKDGEEWSVIRGNTPENDIWAPIQGLLNDFNKTVQKNYSQSDQLCLDESMSAFKPRQSKHANLPKISYIARKPEPFGTEFKTVADARTNIMLHLEVQRDKDEMKEAQYVSKYKGTTACTLRMGERTTSSNPSHKDTLFGDSWFASVKTAIAVDKELGCHFVGHVKNAHSRFPKVFFEKVMEEWPGGTHLVLQSCFGKKNLVAIGYKYNKKKICMFIMTLGADLTSHGDPYLAKFKSDKGNYRSREVQRPRVASNYFRVAGAVDGNNQIRQGELELERHWRTHDGWFRCVTTVLGIAATNAFYACNYSFASEVLWSKLKAKEFVGILCHQLLKYPFPDVFSFGRNTVGPGQEAPPWYDVVPGRFNPTIQLERNQSVLADITNMAVERTPEFIFIGKTKMRPGWKYTVPKTVPCPNGAPELPTDIRDYHKQTQIYAGVGDDGVRHRPPQCKMCRSNGLKQKKPPYLCGECNSFFCHDTEMSTGSTFPRQCYWAHMCIHYRKNGLASASWCSSFDTWNAARIKKCKESDGIA